MSRGGIDLSELTEQATLLERREVLLETARQALEFGDRATLRLVLNSQHPADLAELLRLLSDDEREWVVPLVAEPLVSRALAESDPLTVQQVAAELDEEVLSDLVEDMAPDDAADVLGDLPVEQSERVLELMEGEEASEVRELMTHPEDSGGGIMTSRLVAVGQSHTVDQAVSNLREWADEEDILTLFVVDDERHLVGTVPLRRMLLASRDTLVGELADRDPICVRADVDQEEIAAYFSEYDLLVLPVVDEDGELVGQVTVDDIVEVIQEEAAEDLSKMAAIGAHEDEERSAFGVMRRRLPWLLFCLVGTLVSGGVLDLFSGVLAAVTPLILFVPAIMAMGGNSGIQTSTVTVRSLATGHAHTADLRRTVWRELRVAAGMGLLLGGAVYTVARAWIGDETVARCAGLAMLCAIVVSAVLGAVVPLAFRALRIDPAVASGPLITTLNDILSLLIYFGIAAGLMQLWG